MCQSNTDVRDDRVLGSFPEGVEESLGNRPDEVLKAALLFSQAMMGSLAQGAATGALNIGMVKLAKEVRAAVYGSPAEAGAVLTPGPKGGGSLAERPKTPSPPASAVRDIASTMAMFEGMCRAAPVVMGTAPSGDHGTEVPPTPHGCDGGAVAQEPNGACERERKPVSTGGEAGWTP